jgi:menaquinone-dependent protoporphyrinogen oxidase
MSHILVAYTTMAGSTAEIAKGIGEELARPGHQVDVLPLDTIKTLEGYDGVVVGAPMILGWHRSALGFLKKHRKAFQNIPLAVFAAAMSLTQTDNMGLDGVPICIDEKLPKPPEKPGQLTFKEKYATLANYFRPVLQAIRPGKPVTIAIFGGRLEYGRLKWWAVLFAMLIIQAPAGDRRNWACIRAWAASLPSAFQL